MAEFRRMFTDAAQCKFDLVLVWALDRFTREGVREMFEYIRRLTSHGAKFVSFTEDTRRLLCASFDRRPKRRHATRGPEEGWM